MQSNKQENHPPNGRTENTRTTDPPRDLKPVTLAQVRKSFNHIAGKSIAEIANGLVDAAKQGKVMSARYLLELAGIYPVPDDGNDQIEEGSLAAALLKHLGLPTEPVPWEDVPSPSAAEASVPQPARAEDTVK